MIFLTRHLSLRQAQPGDAPFMLNVRNNDPRHLLSPIQGTVADQRNYILASKSRDETLFIIGTTEGIPVGVVRWTDLTHTDHMGWESLIVAPTAPPVVGIDAMVTTYTYCFRVLGRPLLGPWRVPRVNERMQAVHERMGFARVVDENDTDLMYAVTEGWFDENYTQWHNRGFGQLR